MPVSFAASLLLAALVSVGPGSEVDHDFQARGLDSRALERAARARVGEELDAWRIRIDRVEGGAYRVDLLGPRGQHRRRRVELAAQSAKSRSRELAATIALLISGATNLAPPRGFVGLETQVQLGPPAALDPALGLGASGGVWLLHDYLQPRASFSWSRSWAGDLRLDAIGGGLGLAAGAPIGYFWVGGLVMPVFAWNQATNVGRDSGWSGGAQFSALAQFRLPRLVVGLRTGVETRFPAVEARSDQSIGWGHVRWQLALEVGFGI